MIKKFSFFLKIGLFVLVLSCKGNKESAEFFNRGNFHFKKNEFEKATHFYSEAIEKRTEFADAYLNRGIAFLKVGNEQQSLLDFKQAIEIDPDFVEAKIQLAKMYTDRNEIEKSDSLLQGLEVKAKDNADYHDALGRNYAARFQWQAAKRAFSQGLKLNVQHVEILNNLAVVYLKQKRADLALAYLLEAEKLNPTFDLVLNNLGICYIYQRRFDRAIQTLLKAFQYNTSNLYVLNNLAWAFLEKNQPTEAREYIEKVEKIKPDDPYLLRNKALYLLKNNHAKEALSQLKTLEVQHPEIEFLYYHLAQTALATHQTSTAREAYNKSKSIGEKWPPVQ